MDVKSNRLAALSDKDRNVGRWTRLDELDIAIKTLVKVYLKDLEIPVLFCKQIFTNKDKSTGENVFGDKHLELSSNDSQCSIKKDGALKNIIKASSKMQSWKNSNTD